MKKAGLVLLFFVLSLSSLAAQQKYALVIGNGAYTGITRLNNPVNDANDISAALRGLGFTVDQLTNAGRVQMEEAVMRLKNRLGAAQGSYGFFYYAGHGVQSGGENYLIPVDASIPGEAYLRDRSVSMQAVLDELNAARNTLNIVVLDACRDNPFSWRRSASRGLQVVSNQPADSIIVYATSAGSAAADGEGRNGLFTTHLLNNLQKPDLEVNEVFRLTGADVRRASGGMQIPAIYSQFFDVAYLGNRPAVVTPAPGPRPPVVNPRLAPASQPTSTPQQPQTGNATYNASRTGAYIAHSSLALNTRVKVTNLANGLSAEAVVTGRIAINPDRIADISGELGDILRMSRTGVTRVQIEELPSPAQGTRR